MGFRQAARDHIAKTPPGIPALCANNDPQTIAEAFGTMDDGYRRMLLDATHGDRTAHRQAIATIPLWWNSMPQTVRNNIDYRVDHWAKEHGHATTGPVVTRRKLDLLLPQIRNERRSGLTKLGPAARLPA